METLMGLVIGFGMVALLVLIVLVTLLMVEVCVHTWRRIFSLKPLTKRARRRAKQHPYIIDGYEVNEAK